MALSSSNVLRQCTARRGNGEAGQRNEWQRRS
uniref:Uncharacterized protein n=1 Tax=Ackermannviridae sp. TaxID=2831612 RepID=A0A8S5VXV6_9CAUD|nr:MAG TPA: hypothetical protein [Ackermannviridae sp.]